ncbi:unnamed protein product [Meloidogyne enterolobii]|uniref:Uncharacterized protein n=1 Tax=Meloidogyne enterolobii TaxID=390850 RepID=A0ACB0ZNZ0_MELEN
MRASELKLRSAEQIIREKEREIARYKFADRIRAVIVSGDTPKASDIAEMERILEVWKSSLVPTTNEYGMVPNVQRGDRRYVFLKNCFNAFCYLCFCYCSVGSLNLVESTTRIIEVGRGKHKLEGDNVILSERSRIAEREDTKDYNILSPEESCDLHIDYNNNIIVYFQEDGDCIVDFIVEDSDILNFFDTSYTVEFTMVLYNYNDSLSKCLANCSDFELMNTNMYVHY